jgi:Tol biopolymer transport system component
MKRWMIAIVLLFSMLGSAGWISPLAAQDTPTAGSVQTFEVEDGHPIGLSPDGTMYAVSIQATALCVYDTATQQEVSCASLELLNAGIRVEDVVWSPDSTRLAFGEQGFRYGSDGDLWIMDAASGELTNLTDDGFEGSLLSLGNDEEEEPTYYLDVAPAWTPDSQFITFSRSPVINGERQGNDLAQVSAAGGEVEVLKTIPDAEPGAVYFGTGWDPSGDTFYFSLTHLDSDNPENGIWTYDVATGEIAPLALGEDPELGPLTLLRVSPTGEQLLAWYPMAFGQFDVVEPLLRLVDTETGALSTPEIPVPEGSRFPGAATAAFSPDGQALLLIVSGGSGIYQVWVSDLASGEPQLLIEAIEQAQLDLGMMPSWAANGTVLLGRGIGGGYLFTIDGIGREPIAHPAASTATPSPATGGVPVGGPVRTVELPAGRAVSMSPNGHYLAVAVPPQESLCVYDVATMAEVSCADLSVLNTGLRSEDVIWSPDSTRLAFSERTLVTFRDGDLWVIDAATGTLTNLTDDGYDGAILIPQDDGDDIEYFADVSPAWTPDSQYITFSRTIFGAGGIASNVVAQIPAAGGEVETLVPVGDAPGIFYYRAHWSPDGERFYYSVAFPDLDNPDNGIWVYDKATGNARLLAVSDDPEFGTLVLREVSPAGDRLLAYYPAALTSYGYVNRSVLRFVDPATGELSPVPDPAPESEIFEGTWIATFSPDGQYLLQAVGMDGSSRDFWATNLATGEATNVASDLEGAVPIDHGLGPVWGTDGTVFVAWHVVGAHFFPIEGAGLGAVPALEASPVSGQSGFAPGTTAYTNSLTPVFAGPDANATVVSLLAPNRPVHILGDPVQNEQGAWYPILDPETQIIGYVHASRLE